MTTKPNTCTDCGAPLKSSRVCGWGTLEIYTCGKIFDDGPGSPCRNRDERTARDESTQPPEAEEPEAMQFQIDTTEPAVAYPEVSTLPAIKPLADAALERLGLAVATVTRLKSYKDLVLSDLTDKKGAKDLTEKRLEVKRFRTAWERECEDGREESNAISKGWTTAQKVLADPFKEVEKHLAEQVEAHEREVARIAREAEQARQAKIQARLDAMSAAGIPVDLVRATELSDEAWTEYLGKALEAKAKLDAATKVAEELTALGDECTAGEALQLTDEQIKHRLGVARKADSDRKETARIKAEEEAEAKRKADDAAQAERDRLAAEERTARERLERGAQRMREMALLGASGDLDALADMTPEAYAVALETARQEKEDRDARIAEERRQQEEKDAELARLKKIEADRLEAERVALEARESEAKANADKAAADAKAAREEAEKEVLPEPWPVVEIPDDESALVRGICSTHDHETEPQKIAAWARAVLDGMPSTPAITSASLADRMVATVDGVRESLLALERAMEEA